MSRPTIPLEGAKSTLRVILARGVASALISGFDQAKEEGRPLTEKQKTDMAEMALMQYAEAIAEGEDSMDAEGLLSDLARTALDHGN